MCDFFQYLYHIRKGVVLLPEKGSGESVFSSGSVPMLSTEASMHIEICLSV